MYYKIEVINNLNIGFFITSMIRWSLADSSGHFWQPLEFVNVVNLDFENIKHLQNLGHSWLTAARM